MQDLPTRTVSVDNFRNNGGGDAAMGVDPEGLNGLNNFSSGLYSPPKIGSLSSSDERERLTGSSEEKGVVERLEQDCAPGGNTVFIPQLRDAVDANKGRQ